MRTLADAGIGWRPPFVKAEIISDRPFEIVRAVSRPSGFNAGQFEIVMHARLLVHYPGYVACYSNDGEQLRDFSWSAALVGQREDIVAFFLRTPNETLGPCQFMWLETNNGTGNAFVSIETYAGELPAQPRSITRGQPVSGTFAPVNGQPATSRTQVARNFPNQSGRAAAPSARGTATAGRAVRSTADEMPPELPYDDDLGDLPF